MAEANEGAGFRGVIWSPWGRTHSAAIPGRCWLLLLQTGVLRVSMLTVDLLFSLHQQLKHFLYHGLQSTAQCLRAVRFVEGGHMHKGRASPAQVQRGVVGVVTQVPGKVQRYELRINT